MKFVPGGDVDLQLEMILRNGVDFVNNIDGAFVEFTTTGEEQTITHALGRKPIGFIVFFKDASVDIWGTRPQSWTNETLSLRASAANVTVRLYVA